MEKASQTASLVTEAPATTPLPTLMDQPLWPQTLKDAAIVLGLVAVYFVAGKSGLKLAFVNSSASAVWPPTGIALASLLVLGMRFWPAILLGAFLVNVTTSGDLPASLGIALGNTLEGVVGCWLVSRFAGGRRAFERPQDIFKFAILAGMLSTALSATIGTNSLLMRGLDTWSNFWPIWLTWWMGDTVGAMVVTPLLVVWFSRRNTWSSRHYFEAFVMLACLIVVGQMVFGGVLPFERKTYPLEFLCLPFLVWAGFRLGHRGATLATVVLSATSVNGTLMGFGPFARGTPNESLLLLQAFIGVTSVMALALAGLVLDRERHEEALRQLAISDSLTGLANHRLFSDRLSREVGRSVRTERHFAVLLLDVDGLKEINDRYGHLVGSRALVRVAENLRHNCRTFDTPARFGGDEFEVLLPETEESEAQQVAERIVQRLSEEVEEPPVSVSVGLAMYPRDGQTPEALLGVADRGLYQMKRTNGGVRRQARRELNSSRLK